MDKSIENKVSQLVRAYGLSFYDDQNLPFFTSRDTYPNDAFLARHYKIIEPYKDLIDFYKGEGYLAVNTFYKTGHIPQFDTEIIRHPIQILFQLGTPPSNAETWKLFAQAMKDLEQKIEPLSYSIPLYRGVYKSTIGQNFFTGKCVVTQDYDRTKTHRYCEKDDISSIHYLTQPAFIVDSVYENLGLVSASSSIHTGAHFASYDSNHPFDTLLMTILPAGTKFILPLEKVVIENGTIEYIDGEKEFILFPLHNTFLLYKQIRFDTVDPADNLFYPVKGYLGVIANDLNKYRPRGMPQKRELRS